MSAVKNDEVFRAQLALEVALNRFNWVTEKQHGKFALDSAIYSLNAAEFQLRAALQRAKNERECA